MAEDHEREYERYRQEIRSIPLPKKRQPTPTSTRRQAMKDSQLPRVSVSQKDGEWKVELDGNDITGMLKSVHIDVQRPYASVKLELIPTQDLTFHSEAGTEVLNYMPRAL